MGWLGKFCRGTEFTAHARAPEPHGVVYEEPGPPVWELLAYSMADDPSLPWLRWGAHCAAHTGVWAGGWEAGPPTPPGWSSGPSLAESPGKNTRL